MGHQVDGFFVQTHAADRLLLGFQRLDEGVRGLVGLRRRGRLHGDVRDQRVVHRRQRLIAQTFHGRLGQSRQETDIRIVAGRVALCSRDQTNVVGHQRVDRKRPAVRTAEERIDPQARQQTRVILCYEPLEILAGRTNRDGLVRIRTRRQVRDRIQFRHDRIDGRFRSKPVGVHLDPRHVDLSRNLVPHVDQEGSVHRRQIKPRIGESDGRIDVSVRAVHGSKPDEADAGGMNLVELLNQNVCEGIQLLDRPAHDLVSGCNQTRELAAPEGDLAAVVGEVDRGRLHLAVAGDLHLQLPNVRVEDQGVVADEHVHAAVGLHGEGAVDHLAQIAEHRIPHVPHGMSALGLDRFEVRDLGVHAGDFARQAVDLADGCLDLVVDVASNRVHPLP